MISLNKVLAAGHLTRNPAVRQTAGGQSVGKFGLAVNERYTTPGGGEREEVCFVDVEVWGRQAESCGQFLGKGSAVMVEGRLRCERWDDKETGKPRQRLLLRAERVHFLGNSGDAPSDDRRNLPGTNKRQRLMPPPSGEPAGFGD